VIRAAPTLSIAVMIGPTLAGLAGAARPAFGLLPALGGTRLSLEPWRELFAEPGIGRSIALSLWIGFAATLISYLMVIGLLAACWETPMLRWMSRLLAPLLSVPHAAAALGLAFLIAPSGWIARLLSPEITGWTRPPDLLILNDPLGVSAILGLALKEAPFLFLMALAALPQIDAERGLRLGRSFGYGRIAAFLFIVLPPLGRQIRLPVFAVLAFAASNVEVATILGPTTPPTLAVRLIGWLSDPDLSRRFVASAGALVQLAVVVALITGWAALASLAGHLAHLVCASGRRFARDGPIRLVAAGAATLSGAAAFASLAGLVVWSLAGPWRFPDAWPASAVMPNAADTVNRPTSLVV
jgi:putative thiamine transport system permease protein